MGGAWQPAGTLPPWLLCLPSGYTDNESGLVDCIPAPHIARAHRAAGGWHWTSQAGCGSGFPSAAGAFLPRQLRLDYPHRDKWDSPVVARQIPHHTNKAHYCMQQPAETGSGQRAADSPQRATHQSRSTSYLISNSALTPVEWNHSDR